MSTATAEKKQRTADFDSVMELMGEMGARSFDPMPPDQHKWQMGEDEPPLYRMWSWMCRHTIHWGARSPHAINKDGQELHMEHVMADLDWDAPTAYRYWRIGLEKGLWRNGKSAEDKRKLFFCGRVRALKPADAPEGKPGPIVCTDNSLADFPYEIRKQIASRPPEEIAALHRKYMFEEHLERYLTSTSVAAVRAFCIQRKDNLWAEVGAIPKHQEHKKRDETEEQSALRRARVEPLVPQLELFVQTIQESVQSDFESSYKGLSNTVQTTDLAPSPAVNDSNPSKGKGLPTEQDAAASLLGSETQKTARVERANSANPQPSGKQNPSHDGKKSDGQVHTVEKPARQTEAQPEADLNLQTQLDAVREAVEEAWGNKLQPNDVIPAKLLEAKNNLGFPLRALVMWVHDFGQKKASEGYAINSPMLFVTSAPRDLPVWGHAHHRIIEAGLKEEQRAEYARGYEERDQLFRQIAVLEESLKLSDRVSPENPDHFRAVVRIQQSLPAGALLAFLVFCAGEAKQIDRRSFGKEPARKPGASGPRILGLMEDWVKRYVRNGKARGAPA